MDPEDLNDILLYAVPNYWALQSYLQGWNFERRTYKDTCDMFERMEIAEAVYEGGTPSKNTQWAESGRASFSGSKREEEPPCHPTPIRAVLVSARETMQDIQAMRRPVRKIHACCMAPGTLLKSAKCFRTNPKIMSCSDHLKTSNTDPASTNAARQSSLRVPQRRQISWNIMMSPSKERKRGKGIIRKPIVTNLMHIHQRMDAVMDLTV